MLEEYPRPGMRRESYVCLNGFWDYAITGSKEFPEEYDGRILVPFSPEAELSGVNRILMPDMFLHYRRQFSVGRMEPGKRLLLYFGAVDQFCEVYVNVCRLGDHIGGYWHFSFDITSAVHEGENLPLVVRPQADRCVALSEFGGYFWHIPEHSFTSEEFGYRKYHSSSQLTSAIERLWNQELEENLEKGLSASVHTQLSDVEDETNGLMTYDREILKVDAETLRGLNARLQEAFEHICS